MLDANGNICTWGKNNSGELALGDDRPRNQLTVVNSLKRKSIKKVYSWLLFWLFVLFNIKLKIKNKKKKISCGSNFLICIGG